MANAVRADMQNLGMILRLMKGIAPGLDVKSTAEEIRARIGDELDYELEAQNQRTLARIFRGHPFIRVPEVVTSLSREKVLVSEYVTGLGFDAIKELDQDTRDRVGEIIFRFFFGCMYRHRQFSGDPHPGNFLLQPDGSVAFLDFGLFKVMPAELIEIELACQRAGHEGDGERLHEIFSRTAFCASPTASGPTSCWPSSSTPRGGTCSTRGPSAAGDRHRVMIEMSDPRSSHFGQMRHETLPADHLFGRRVELLTLAVLSPARGEGQLHRIAREWMYGDEPHTELGRDEAEVDASSRKAPTSRRPRSAPPPRCRRDAPGGQVDQPRSRDAGMDGFGHLARGAHVVLPAQQQRRHSVDLRQHVAQVASATARAFARNPAGWNSRRLVRNSR